MVILVGGLLALGAGGAAAPEPPAMLAYETPDGIHFIRIDGSDRRRLPGTRPGDQNPDWSPDGERIVFWHEEGGRGSIYVSDAEGSYRRRLTEDEDRVNGWPDWSPDGNRIVFESCRGDRCRIDVVAPDGTRRRTVTSGGWSPTWSPDATRIVFTAAWWKSGLAVVNADGTGVRPLQTRTVEDWAPSWSPDGEAIAFNSEVRGKAEIYVLRGDSLTRVTRNDVGDFDAAWSPDGEAIAFTTSRTGLDEVYVMAADGTRQRRVTREPRKYACCASWRP